MHYLRFVFFIFALSCAFSASAAQANRYDRKSQPLHRYSPHAKTHCVHVDLTNNAKAVIILDAGHGGTDEGAKVSNFMEKKAALSTTLLTKQILEEMGYRVILTRSRDTFLALDHRVSIANKTQGSAFVSIHFNASTNNTAKGIEVFYCKTAEGERTRDSKRLASCILPSLIDQTEAISRGVKQAKFLVIKDTRMPAVLVEGGFMTNPEERALLKEKSYQEKIAKGIAKGIDKFLKS